MASLKERIRNSYDILNLDRKMSLWSSGWWTVIFILMMCFIAATEGAPDVLPASWEGLCTIENHSKILELYVDDVITNNPVILIQCHVTEKEGNSWRFQTLQDHLRNVHDFTVFLRADCNNGGKLSLPWPMKANGLVGLVVLNCLLTDRYADMGNPNISQSPDQLRVLEIRNSVWLDESSKLNNLTSTIDLDNLDSDYDCGHDRTIEYFVSSNVSFDFSHTPGDTTVISKPVYSTLDSSPGDTTVISNPVYSTLDPSPGDTTVISNPVYSTLDPSPGDTTVISNPVYSTLDPSPGDTTSSSSKKQNNLHLQKFKTTKHQNTNPNSSDLKLRDNSAENDDITPTRSDEDVINPDVFNTTNITLESVGSADEFKSLMQKLLSLDIKCRFDKLRLIDESNPQVMPIQHFRFMLHGASYPELRIMNYSGSGIRELPDELQNFRENFPKLQYLDLSRNYLREIHLVKSPKVARGTSLTLDVRSNLITDVSFQDVLAWSKIDDVVVNIRNNPIHCGCHMTELLREIQTETISVEQRLQKYKYITYLECATPIQFKGQTVSQVGTYCDNNNRISTSPTDDQISITSRSARILILPTVAAMIILLAIMIVVIVARSLRQQERAANSVNNSPGSAGKQKDVESGVYVLKVKSEH